MLGSIIVIKLRCSLCFFILCLIPWSLLAQVSQNVLAENQPQYELGMGLITLNLPDYPGSNNNRLRAIPFPYYIYRGEYLRSDDEGTRTRFITGKKYELGMSFGLNFPVRSTDNPGRTGMPDLDALVAFGPRLLIRLLTDNSRHKLNLIFAFRNVFSSKLSPNNLLRSEGHSFEPRISYWYQWPNTKTTLFSSFDVEFGSAKYNRFFYNVTPDFATSSRPTYTAQAGVVQTALSLGFGQQLSPKVFMFAGSSWRNLNWAANNNSPLVESRDNLGFLVGLIWAFFESEDKVKRL